MLAINEGNNYNKSSVINDNNKDNTKINDTNFSQSFPLLLTRFIFYFKQDVYNCVEKNKNHK